jgi:light-regulated signal transduction histidine kinase (bacteriophytochrome)
MVASYTQLLASRYKGRLDSDADEFIAFAVDGCNRMQGLIQDLLAYSRAGTNGKALCEVSAEDALQRALTNLRITIEQSGAIVSYDPLPKIQTDETQLTQVLENLVGNAIKYRSAEVPRVHVSAVNNGDKEWIFSVRDNGLGIATQYFERIFILFQGWRNGNGRDGWTKNLIHVFTDGIDGCGHIGTEKRACGHWRPSPRIHRCDIAGVDFEHGPALFDGQRLQYSCGSAG